MEDPAAANAVLRIVVDFIAETRAREGFAPPVGLDSDLERELGLDSLKRAALLLRLEKAFSVRLPVRTLASAESPRDLLRAVRAGGPAVPVPIYPPVRRSQLEEHLRRQSGILANCQARMLITVPEARTVARLLRVTNPALHAVVAVADLEAGGTASTAGSRARPGAQDIAFLQYTSGSTGNPKGVILTRANLLANIRAMGRAIDVAPTDVFVSWLPLYHDMGYIAGGELFVTGRAKDIVIRGGQHVHPQEAKTAIGAIPGVRKGCVSVFGVPDKASGTEKVVVLAETRETDPAKQEALRKRAAFAARLGRPSGIVPDAEALVHVPFEQVRFPPGEPFFFEAVTPDGEVHSIPVNRVRSISRDGAVIWHR